ncbi:carboxypeptidase regulatory-like domain-containing protein [Diplocloster hominis]|uniref:carboxypeptidase regulatory-like domain-containing protein n=1 Tax=Diplocloster hominis TaxID=3079010 RepID=UPI0031BB9B47
MKDADSKGLRKHGREMCRRLLRRTFTVLVACAMISSTMLTNLQVAYAGENVNKTEGGDIDGPEQMPQESQDGVQNVSDDMASTDAQVTAQPGDEPQAAGTPDPANGPEATESPAPGNGPEATESPAPADNPEAAESPVPGSVPEAPVPTDTPEPTDTPAPDGTAPNADNTDADTHLTITEFSNWNPDTICEVKFKTRISDLGLPETLDALVTSAPQDADTEQTGNDTTEPNTIKIPVQWNGDHYDGTVLGDYVFQASPAEGYLAEQNLTLKEGLLFPAATVRVVSAGPVVLESDLGVTVTADNEEIVDPDTSLNVEKSQVADEVLQELAEKEENISYDNMAYQNLDISLEIDGEQVQPEGQVEVSMEIPEGMAEENFAVYHLADDGTLTKMEGRVEDGKYIFQTTHFSEYLGVSTLNVSGPVTTYSELTAAISAANSGDTITIQGEIPLSSNLSISKNLTLTGGTIYRSSSGGKITIYGDVILDGITIDGKGISSSLKLIQVFPGGKLVIDQGTVIQNQMSTESGCSALYIGDDTDAGNAACVMVNGSIVNNTCGAQGAGILIKKNATFHMQGGVISGNRTTNESNNYSGAGVYNLGSLYLEGGRVSDNHAAGWGGGIYNTSLAKTFVMTGGIIESSNTATKGSGVFHSAQNEASAEFHISGNAQVNAEIYLDYNSGTADKFAYLDGPLNYTITIKPLNYAEGKVIAKVSDTIKDEAAVNNILNQSIKKITVPVVGSGSTASVWYTYLDTADHSIKITQNKPDYKKDQVYVDGQNGSDSTGDGTKDNPVQSFDKAKDYLDHNGTIIVKDPIIVDNDQTWELPSDVYGDDSKVVIDTGSGEPVVVVKPGGTLNLGDIVIQNPEGDTVIVVEGGTLNTSPDTTLTGKDGTGVVEHVLDVTAKLSNITHNGPRYVNSGEAYSTTLTPEAGYGLPDTITVLMGTVLQEGTGYTYDKTSGVVSITSVTDSVSITASGKPIPVQLTATANNITGKVQKAITPVELQVTGGSGNAELSISEGTLPAGLALENNQIAGTPTETQTGTVTVQAADANGTTAAVQINVDIQPNHGEITGRIADVNGLPLNGVQVTLKDGSDQTIASTVTNAAGDYKMSNLPDGSYTLTAQKDTVSKNSSIDISNDGANVTGDRNFKLPVGGADLTGTVTDVNKQPVEGAEVVIKDSQGNELGRDTTDSNGDYTIPNVPDGNHDITIVKDGKTETGKVEIKDNGKDVSGTGDVQLPVGGADLTGTITDVNKQPVKDAQVVVKDETGKEIGRDTTDSNGEYTIPNVPDGKYDVTIEADGKTETGKIEITNNGHNVSGTDDVQMPTGGAELSGTVTDVNGNPVEGAEVVVKDHTGNELGRDTTDVNGDYTIPNVPDGTHDITIEKDGKSESSQVEISDNGHSVTGGGDGQIQVGGADVTGTITDVNKQPVEGAEVVIKDSQGNELGRDTTDSNGDYAIPNVPDGNHDITIEKDGKTETGKVEVKDNGKDVSGTGDVQLPVGGADLTGTITDVNKQPVKDAQVVVKDETGKEIGRDTTDSNGEYTIPNVPDGKYDVTIEADGKTETGKIEITNNGHNVSGTDDVQMPTGGAELSGTVTDVNGNPVEGAEVVVKDHTGNELGRDTTDVNGDYTIPNVPDGTHDITIEKDGKSESSQVEISDNGHSVTGGGDGQIQVGGADVTGTITDVNKQPVEGAEVVIKDSQGNELGRDTTDSNGDYTIPNVPDGNHDITIEKDGKTETGKVEIKDNGKDVSETDDVQLPVGGADLNGNITDVNGKPVEGAEVVVKDETGKELGRDTTDSSGDYTIPNVPDGTHDVTIEKDGKTETGKVEITGNGQNVTGTDDVQLPVGGADVEGKVTDVNGKPVEGAEVVIKDQGGKELGKDTTDANGDYQIPNVPDGSHSITIEKDGKTENGSVDITEGGQKVEGDKNAQIQAGGASVEGTITDKDGNPISDAEVTVKDENGKELGKDITDQNGHYEITNIPDGEHSLTVDKDGKANTSELKVEGEKVTEVNGQKGEKPDISTNLGAEISGTLTNDQKDPVSGAQITAKDDKGTTLDTDVTDENGRYHIENLPDGTITVTITHPKYPEHSIQVTVNGGKTDLSGGLHIQKDTQVKAAEDAIRALIDPNTSSEAQISSAKSQIAQAKELYDALGGKQSQVEDKLIRKLDQLIRKAVSLEVSLDIKTAGTQVALQENPEDLIGLVVSSEELNNSKSIRLVITVTAIAADAAEKQQIQQAAGGRTVGSYFDISLIKNITWQDGSQESLLVSNVPREIVFTITIPEGMRGGRDYAVVRYHDGVAEVLQTTQIGDTLRFSSDRYSTYAIIYTPIEKHDVPDTKHNNDSQSSGSDSQISAAQTGDQNPMGLMMMLSLAGLFGIAAIFTRKKIVNRK